MANPQASPGDEILALETAISGDEPDPTALQLPAELPGSVVVQGTIWTVAGFGAMRLLQFGFNIPLTHLVNQSVFGVMTLVNLFIQGLHMFSDLGIRQCVVNSPRGDEPTFLNTAWTVQVMRGLFLWIVSLVVCWPLSRYYDSPQLQWLLPIIGITAIFDGLTSTASITMSRRLRRDKLVVREVAAYAISMTFVISWLYLLHRFHDGAPDPSRQMMAFAIGNVLSNAIEMALSYTLIRGAMNRFAWDRSAARELLHFGGWIFISTACTYLAANFDRLYVGKLSFETLANYQIAAMLARAPTQVVWLVGHQVLFPLYSRLRLRNEPLDTVFPLIHTSINGAAAYLVAGAFAACPTLIWLVYDARYLPAAEFVRWLTVAAWFSVLQTSCEVVLLGLGRTRQIAIGQIVKLIVLGPMLLGGYYYQGIVGVMIGYTITEALRYAFLCFVTARAGLPVLRIDWMITALIAITAGIVQFVGRSIGGVGDSKATLGIRLAAEIAVMTAFWGSFLAFWWPRHGRQLVTLLGQGK